MLKENEFQVNVTNSQKTGKIRDRWRATHDRPGGEIREKEGDNAYSLFLLMTERNIFVKSLKYIRQLQYQFSITIAENS